MSLDLIFSSLVGLWSLERTIISFEGGLLGSFKGKASYNNIASSVLYYREEGVLCANSCESCAFREYYFHFEGGIKIYFDSKLERLFHEMEFEKMTIYPFHAKGIHYCGQDVYNLAYIFNSENEYRVTCSVTGPRKNYTITSHLSRCIA